MIAPKLQIGDEIRVIAPSYSLSHVWEEKAQKALRHLEHQGFRVTFSKHSREIDEEKLTAEVIAIHRFDSFAELYQKLPLLKCGYKKADIETAKPEDMDLYYTPEQQAKYGVLGIEIKIIGA